MKIHPVDRYNITDKAANNRIPKNASVVYQEKSNYIQNLKLASAFDNFEQSMKKTIELFVYMVKVVYKG